MNVSVGAFMNHNFSQIILVTVRQANLGGKKILIMIRDVTVPKI